MSRVLASIAVTLAIACASGVRDPSLPQATANVEVVSVAPVVGSVLAEDTVFLANVTYAIENFQSNAGYYIASVFASNRGTGVTFSMVDRFADTRRIREPAGSATIRYPIARELRSTDLARPVRIWIYLMERTGAQTTRVIGQVGPFEYSVE
jgi:hypothetical protein